jgi:hypothetical protein
MIINVGPFPSPLRSRSQSIDRQRAWDVVSIRSLWCCLCRYTYRLWKVPGAYVVLKVGIQCLHSIQGVLGVLEYVQYRAYNRFLRVGVRVTTPLCMPLSSAFPWEAPLLREVDDARLTQMSRMRKTSTAPKGLLSRLAHALSSRIVRSPSSKATVAPLPPHTPTSPISLADTASPSEGALSDHLVLGLFPPSIATPLYRWLSNKVGRPLLIFMPNVRHKWPLSHTMNATTDAYWPEPTHLRITEPFCGCACL